MPPVNRFLCPHCGKQLKAPEHAAGRIISCPKCSQSLVIPPPIQTTEQTPPESEVGGQLVPFDRRPIETQPEIIYQPPAPVVIHFETPSQPNKTGPLLLSLLIVAILVLGVVVLVVMNAPKKSGSLASKEKAPPIQPAPRREQQDDDQQPARPQPAKPDPQQPASPNREQDSKRMPPPEREQAEEDIEKELERQREKIAAEKKAKPDPVLAMFGRLNHALANHDQKESIAALNEFAKLGQAARPASRLICIAVLDKSREVSQAAIEALEKVNPPIAVHVITLRVDPTPEKRAEAVAAIAEMGDDGRPAVPVIVKYIADKFSNFRSFDESELNVAISALARFGPDDSEARSMLIFVNDYQGSETLRTKAITLLGNLGQASTENARKQIVPALQRRLDKEDRPCLIPTLEALAKFCSDAKPAEPAMKKYLTDKDAKVRDAVHEAMKKLEEEPKAVAMNPNPLPRFDPMPQGVNPPVEPPQDEKIRTLSIEDFVRHINKDTLTANQAIAAAAATGNGFKLNEAIEKGRTKWNDKWAGKKVRVSGPITLLGPYALADRTRADDGTVVILMQGTAGDTSAHYWLFSSRFPWQVDFIISDEAERGRAKRMKMGEKVIVEGTLSKLNGSFRVEDCRIIGHVAPMKNKQ
jgi:hypothetical protein